MFRSEGEYWTVEFEDRIARLRDTAGLRYLAQLLRRPGESLHVLDLRTSAPPASSPNRPASPKAAEDARVAVTKAIKYALERITAAHPPLGAHLHATIRRGYLCRYLPDPRHPIRWRE